MEYVCFGFMLGAILTTAMIAIGETIHDYRDDQRKLDGDSDIRIYTPCRDRDRSGDHGRDQPSLEEKIMVLWTLRSVATGYEKEVVNAVIEDLERGETNEQDNQHRELNG